MERIRHDASSGTAPGCAEGEAPHAWTLERTLWADSCLSGAAALGLRPAGAEASQDRENADQSQTIRGLPDMKGVMAFVIVSGRR